MTRTIHDLRRTLAQHAPVDHVPAPERRSAVDRRVRAVGRRRTAIGVGVAAVAIGGTAWLAVGFGEEPAVQPATAPTVVPPEAPEPEPESSTRITLTFPQEVEDGRLLTTAVGEPGDTVLEMEETMPDLLQIAPFCRAEIGVTAQLVVQEKEMFTVSCDPAADADAATVYVPDTDELRALAGSPVSIVLRVEEGQGDEVELGVGIYSATR